MSNAYREGMIVRKPFERLTSEEIRLLDSASKQILENIGILCFNKEAVDIFK